MSKESPSSVSKRPIVSIPFLIGACTLGVAAYFAGPTVMTYVMYLQEKMIASSSATDDPALAGLDPNATEGSNSTDGANQGGAGRGPGSGSFDPERMFSERDVDGNGKLEGDEISERMKRGLAETDIDKDGAVSKEEFMKRMERMAGGGAGGGGGPSGPFPETPTSDSSSTTPATENSSAPADNPPA